MACYRSVACLLRESASQRVRQMGENPRSSQTQPSQAGPEGVDRGGDICGTKKTTPSSEDDSGASDRANPGGKVCAGMLSLQESRTLLLNMSE